MVVWVVALIVSDCIPTFRRSILPPYSALKVEAACSFRTLVQYVTAHLTDWPITERQYDYVVTVVKICVIFREDTNTNLMSNSLI
jgi:hypothetical protein